MKLIMNWINKGGKVVSGGHLEAELFKVEKMRSLVGEWSRRGSLIRLQKEKIETKANLILPSCKSNDAHVVAAAVIGNVDIVVTEDNKLIEDLKNKKISGKKIRALKEPKFNQNNISRQMKLLNTSDC